MEINVDIGVDVVGRDTDADTDIGAHRDTEMQ